MRLKRMGVINITPNSFSDGNQLKSLSDIQTRIKEFGTVHALDIGAESTGPMSEPISALEECSRWSLVVPLLSQLKCAVSADTYHPDTIFTLVKYWKDERIAYPLIWNDVSGKFDEHVKDFLKEGPRFEYVYCHNRAPKRELAGKHLDYTTDEGRIEEELCDFFGPYKHERVIFDPCLGFSKHYDENWYILNHFRKFQQLIRHERWLLGISRKSFLRKKFHLTLEQTKELDQKHLDVLADVLKRAKGEIWIRTHRPELLHQLKV